MPILIRPATPADLRPITLLDLSTNAHHPLVTAAWKNQSDAIPLWVSRYEFLFSFPYRHILVAEQEGEIVGFVVWKEGGEGKAGAEEFKPVFPESANVEMFGYFLAMGAEHKKGLWVEGLAGKSFLFGIGCGGV
jgi:hypothetical protein